MRDLDRHVDTVGVSFSEDLAYCLYARDVWGIATATASRIPRCTPEVASQRDQPGSASTPAGDLDTGWDRWWQAAVQAHINEAVPAGPSDLRRPDELADGNVQQAFQVLYPEAREWMTQCKAEHIQLMRTARTSGIRTAIQDLRLGDFFITCIPVQNSFGQLISPDHALASPALFGNPPDFLDWLGTALAAA